MVYLFFMFYPAYKRVLYVLDTNYITCEDFAITGILGNWPPRVKGRKEKGERKKFLSCSALMNLISQYFVTTCSKTNHKHPLQHSGGLESERKLNIFMS